jgi:GNAT superfamily N-acetyltransferase
VYKFAVETYAQVVDDIRPLLQEHWRELATYHDIPLDPNYPKYAAAQESGMLRIYTVRTDGRAGDNSRLVAYAIYFVSPHHHYQTTKWAISDIILVVTEHRGLKLGHGLFDFLEDALRAEGVEVMYTMAKLKHPELSMLLEMRGHERNEVIHAKRL